MPPAAAQAPDDIWLVADTPLPPSTSGSTSRPPMRIEFSPLNIRQYPRFAPRHSGGFAAPIVGLGKNCCAKQRRHKKAMLTGSATVSVEQFYRVQAAKS